VIRSARSLVLAGVTLLSTAALAAERDAWRVFRSAEGRFSVELPGTPTRSLTFDRSFIGTVTDHLFIVRHGDEKLTVDYSDIPGFAVDFAGADTIYAHAKSALLAQTWSRAVSTREVSLDGVTGRELVYETPPVPGKPKFYGQARFFLVGDRLYVFDAQVAAGASEARARRFLDSISIR
jgi:hypothetical protein